jgi:hypothetical protein
VDGNQDSREHIAPDVGLHGQGLLAAARGNGLLFGAVTFVCLFAAMTLSAYGHRPTLMLPVAIVCAIVFIRHGDGRRHSWTPVSVEDGEPLEGRIDEPVSVQAR